MTQNYFLVVHEFVVWAIDRLNLVYGFREIIGGLLERISERVGEDKMRQVVDTDLIGGELNSIEAGFWTFVVEERGIFTDDNLLMVAVMGVSMEWLKCGRECVSAHRWKYLNLRYKEL